MRAYTRRGIRAWNYAPYDNFNSGRERARYEFVYTGPAAARNLSEGPEDFFFERERDGTFGGQLQRKCKACSGRREMMRGGSGTESAASC